jgi:nucleoside-diphosphate-sugar epimerase
MGGSFILREKAFPSHGAGKRKVLVTGASGNIGSHFSRLVKDRYQLTLMVRDRHKAQGIEDCGEVVEASLNAPARLVEISQGIDTIVHLAADPSAIAEWPSLLSNNIEGTQNLIQAAIKNHCRRVVYASSIHAVSGYPLDHQVQPDDPVNPGDLYGVSKAFGEALARYSTEQHGLSTIVVRIGAFQSRKGVDNQNTVRWMNSFVSRRDLCHLLKLCVDDEKLAFAIVHGLSGNVFNRMDITTTCELLGYKPQDDFSRLHAELRKLRLREEISPHSEKDT